MPSNTYPVGGADSIVQPNASDTASFGLISRTFFGSIDIKAAPTRTRLDHRAPVRKGSEAVKST
jgi:hypothetical protein